MVDRILINEGALLVGAARLSELEHGVLYLETDGRVMLPDADVRELARVLVQYVNARPRVVSERSAKALVGTEPSDDE